MVSHKWVTNELEKMTQKEMEKYLATSYKTEKLPTSTCTVQWLR